MTASCTHGKILLVDTNDEICRLLQHNLATEGFDVKVVRNAHDVNYPVLSDSRLVIADAMEQKFSGFDLICFIKNNPLTSFIPVILCTESTSVDTAIEALDTGADEFIPKPFSLREFLARINALLRRFPNVEEVPVKTTMMHDLVFQKLELRVDTDSKKVTRAGIIIPFTRTEYSIFEFLLRNENCFYTRDQIYSQIWKNTPTSNTRIVDTNISRLRKKLGDASKVIINRYGMGYAFVNRV